MPVDRVGNSLRQAAFWGNLTGTIGRKEWIGGSDFKDVYRFKVSDRSSFSASLQRLKVPSDLYLLNRQGRILQKGIRQGRSTRLINGSLEVGTYFIQVQSRSRIATPYQLRLSAMPFPAATVTVLSPNGGEALLQGEDYLISWADNFDDPVRIELHKGGSFFGSITDIASTDSYVWRVADTVPAGTDYQIKISSTTQPNLHDYSDRLFSITSPSRYQYYTYKYVYGNGDYYLGFGYTHANAYTQDQFLHDVDPNAVGSYGYYQITSVIDYVGTTAHLNHVWVSSYYDGDSSQQTYSIPGGSIGYGDNNLGNENGYAIPGDSATFFGDRYYEADVPPPVVPIITVASPNGGNSWTVGSDYIITWSDNINENVTINLYKSGIYHSTLFSSTLSDGSELWTVPTTLTSGTDYSIRIASTTNPTLYDDSDSGFTINPLPSSSFDIQFDYRFDTIGWFTAEKKAALEAAANVWKAIIKDEFANVPMGTATPYVTNPQTGTSINLFYTDVVIDDLLIFAGARDLPGDSLGEAGSSGWYNNESRYTGADFEPWIGSIAFDTIASNGITTQWFFDPTPDDLVDDLIPNGYSDFISVALHEIAHILGISYGINAFKDWVSNGYFYGSNARALHGGAPIPLDPTWSHIQDGFMVVGMNEHALDPTLMTGTRKLPTALDMALLDDIGYDVHYPVMPSITLTSPNGGDMLTAGSSLTIAWTDNLDEEVRIDLYKNGIFYSAIAPSTASDGSEIGILPANVPSGSDYQLRIGSTTNSNLYDFSDHPFTIS